MKQCIKCGGEMLGDGYSNVLHCENVEDIDGLYLEPDAAPVFCNFPENIS